MPTSRRPAPQDPPELIAAAHRRPKRGHVLRTPRQRCQREDGRRVLIAVRTPRGREGVAGGTVGRRGVLESSPGRHGYSTRMQCPCISRGCEPFAFCMGGKRRPNEGCCTRSVYSAAQAGKAEAIRLRSKTCTSGIALFVRGVAVLGEQVGEGLDGAWADLRGLLSEHGELACEGHGFFLAAEEPAHAVEV